LGDRLPEDLIHALQEFTSTETTVYQDDSPGETLREHQVIELLASQLTREIVPAIYLIPALQARMRKLLVNNKSGTVLDATVSKAATLARSIHLHNFCSWASVAN
jgi:hypothetical protein